MSNPGPTPKAILGDINEVCLVSPDLYATIDGLTPLGIGPFTIHQFNAQSVSNRRLHGQPANFELLVAFATQNKLVVEIMQPLNGTPSLMAEYIQGHGNQAGVQHVAFHMDDLPMEERIMVMKQRGIEVEMEGVWHGKRGTCRFVYFATLAKGAGTCFETIDFRRTGKSRRGKYTPFQPLALLAMSSKA